MGNKDRGREVLNLPNIEYQEIMGATVSEVKPKKNSTGSSWTNRDVWKYFKLLRNYVLCRCKWTSPQIPDYELRLIEWYIFHFGMCAMLRPVVHVNKKYGVMLDMPKIFQCNLMDINNRNLTGNRVTIVDNTNSGAVIETIYDAKDVVIFTDDFLEAIDPNPFLYVTWEFANKLHELDLAFKANSNRNRFPFVFNDISITDNEALQRASIHPGISIAEIVRSAYGRNEAFVSIPQGLVGAEKFLHEPQYIKNDLLDHIEAQKKIYQAFFELLGLYTNKDKKGVYTVKRMQENGDDSPEYITDVLRSNRNICRDEACLKFNIDLTLEMV